MNPGLMFALALVLTVVLVALLVGCFEWLNQPPKLVPAAPAWVTQADVEAMLRERESTRENLRLTRAAAERQLAIVDYRIALDTALADYVPRAEFHPLAGAYCRKSLDEGGELRARVLELIRQDAAEMAARVMLAEFGEAVATPPFAPRVSDEAEAQLRKLTRKRPRPVRRHAKKTRR